MDRYYVVQTIRHVGREFERVMACLQSEDYVAGYKQAVKDMAQVFDYGPVVDRKHNSQKLVLFGGTKGRNL